MSQDTSLLITTEIKAVPKYYLPSVAAWFGSISLGTVIGYTAPGIPSIKSIHSYLHISASDETWFSSLMPLGAVFGAAIAAYVLDKLGRKHTLMFTAVPLIFGWMTIAYALNVTALLVGRLITGICCGLICLSAPVYIAETADPKARGFLGSGFQLNVALGVFLVYLEGAFLPWSWLAVANCVYPVMLLILMCWMPESPTFLIKRKRYLEATEALFFLHGNNPALVNPNQYAVADESEKCGLSDFKRRSVAIPLILCLLLMFFQQFSGINAVMFYCEKLFETSVILTPSECILVVAAFQVVFTFLASVCVDRMGRKILLILSGGLMSTMMAILSLYSYLVSVKGAAIESHYSWIPIMCITVFVSAFSVGYGPIPWLIMSEFLPSKVKGPASGIATAFNWFCCFAVTKEYSPLNDAIHPYGTYFVLSLISLLSIVFVVFKVPETKGKTLMEIEIHFNGGQIN